MSFNLAVILSESARRTPDYPVAVFDGGQLTYRQLDQASDRVAASLAAAGIKPGERIARPREPRPPGSARSSRSGTRPVPPGRCRSSSCLTALRHLCRW
jgi:hypothetical protein